jgi:DNA-binding response OmpR family regulator
MLNIAVVEDNDDLRTAMVGALSAEGHHVVGLYCAEAFSEQAATLPIDLMVVDINLPGEDGLALTRRVRQAQSDIGVIMVTARSRGDDRRVGYESGADIYLTKPVALEELSAAISALSRRLMPPTETGATLSLDLRGLILKGETANVALSAPEAALLAALLRAPERRLETWQIGEIAARGEAMPNRNALNVMMFRLGRKLRQAGAGERPVRAIRNWGYQLCATVNLV